MRQSWFDRGFYDRQRMGADHPDGLEGIAKGFHRFKASDSLNAVKDYRRGWEKSGDILGRSVMAFARRKLKNRKAWPR